MTASASSDSSSSSHCRCLLEFLLGMREQPMANPAERDQLSVLATQEENDTQDEETKPEFLKELTDFSLVLGGPTFQLFRKSRLAGDGLELLQWRLLVVTLGAWL